MDMCIDMCIDMCTDMCIDMCMYGHAHGPLIRHGMLAQRKTNDGTVNPPWDVGPEEDGGELSEGDIVGDGTRVHVVKSLAIREGIAVRA